MPRNPEKPKINKEEESKVVTKTGLTQEELRRGGKNRRRKKDLLFKRGKV